MPKDADANGAYHIAMKGLWNLQQIPSHAGVWMITRDLTS